MRAMRFLLRHLALILGVIALDGAAAAAPRALWPEGKKAAIVLTYDDSLRSQLDVAVPQLDQAGLKGSFFLNGTFAPADLERWRKVAAAGHELGNHSMFHPCPAAAYPADPQFHAERYTVAGMLREIGAMNGFLLAIDGRSEGRSYSVPCSQTIVGGEDYIEPLRSSGLVRYVRTGGQGDGIIADPAGLDGFKVPSRAFSEQHRGSDLIAFADQVLARGGMGIFMFHGVGGDYIAVSADAHRALLDHLRRNDEIWVATFDQAMAWLTRP